MRCDVRVWEGSWGHTKGQWGHREFSKTRIQLHYVVVVPRAEGDVHLKLRHVEHPGRAPGTILTVEHDFDGYLRYCAAMRLVGEPDEDSTSTVGVRPKVASAEIWADPIAHLRLVDFELTTERPGCR